MDYVKEIAHLREKIAPNIHGLDFDKGELYHREICNELALKRDQVIHLKKELQASNSKNFELNRELEISKSLLKESEFNLKLSLKKSSSLEDKLKEVNEAYTNLKFKEEMKISEIKILDENIQKIAHENHQLSREVEELKDKLKYTQAFQDELEKTQIRTNSTISKIKEHSEKIEKEHLQVIELEESLKNSETFQRLSESLMQENDKLKGEILKLENAMIETDAKYQMLYKLIKEQKVVDMHHENIISKIKYLKWESHCKSLQEKNLTNEVIINTLTSSLNKEIETNTQLIFRIEDYEARIKQLENIVAVKKEESDVIEVE